MVEELQLDFHGGSDSYHCLHLSEYLKIWKTLLFEYWSYKDSALFELLWLFSSVFTVDGDFLCMMAKFWIFDFLSSTFQPELYNLTFIYNRYRSKPQPNPNQEVKYDGFKSQVHFTVSYIVILLFVVITM